MHHYTEHLSRWLSCSDASRKFTLSPILCQAVLCFAARHRREDVTADVAYQRCITLLVGCLNKDPVSHDEMLLSAVAILHFAEQFNGRLSASKSFNPHA
jgi:hypothetical protein